MHHGPISAAAVAGAAIINHAVDGFTQFVHALLTPVKVLLKRMHYTSWIKKFILGMLAIRLVTLFVAFVYYLAVTAAGYDSQTTVVNILFVSIFIVTAVLFLVPTMALNSPECDALMHDGRRVNVLKRASLNATMALVTGLMLAIMVFSIVTVGFDHEFDYTNDDDTDVIEGLSSQVVQSSVTIDTTFDVDTDLGLLPLDFEGEVVERDRFEELLRMRFFNWCMFLLVVIDIMNIVARTDVYLLTRRLEKIHTASFASIDAMARQMSTRKLPKHVRTHVAEFELVVLVAALGASVAVSMLLTALFPANLALAVSLWTALGAASAFVVLGAYFFGENA